MVVASDRRLALIREFEQPAQLTVHQLLAELYDGVDWVLVEGFKDSNLLKIEVWRADVGQAGALSRRRFHRGDRHRLAGAAAQATLRAGAGSERSGRGRAVAARQSATASSTTRRCIHERCAPAAAAAGRGAGRAAGACAAAGRHRNGLRPSTRDGRVLAAGPGVRAAGAAAGQQRRWTAMRCAAARSPTRACRCRSASAFRPARPPQPLAPGTRGAHLHRRAHSRRRRRGRDAGRHAKPPATAACASCAVPAPGQWIRRSGEDVQRGAVVLARGRAADARRRSAWRPASACDQLQVARRPRVALFSTGDELVMPGEVPPAQMKPGAIYNSNRFFLRGAARGAWAARCSDLGIVPDRLRRHRAGAARARPQATT